MKGNILVDKLTKKSYYTSELDYDNAFKGKENPNGLFKMLIEPILNSNNEYEIKYMQLENKFKVSGEAYIITGKTEKDIDKKLKKYITIHNLFIQTEVKTEADLW